MTIFLQHLLKDEDGVVLAFGIVFFLLVFLLGMSVYAAGETVRQRMELQNAADAAAYSGAAVQADTISRVACLNRAMSWTYVMLNRRCMDYIADKWLERVEKKWDLDLQQVREQWNWQSTCGTRNEGSDYAAGFGGQHKKILLNKSKLVDIDLIKKERKRAASQGKNWKSLRAFIDQDRKTLAAMFQAERRLLQAMPKRIENTVKHAIADNIADTPNDQAAGGAGIAHVLLQYSPFTYTEIMKNREDQEQIFLVYGKFKPDVREISPRGMDKWWIRQPEGEGFHRAYQQKKNLLLAEWDWFGIKYIYSGHSCHPHLKRSPRTVKVPASEVQDGYFHCGAPVKPCRLTGDFFGGKGAIVVGLKRKLNNSFAFLFPGGRVRGLFSAFSVRGNRYMWTVSAARAGCASPMNKSRQPGVYEITHLEAPPAYSWNLCETDWDATLLPVAVAFDRGYNRKFTPLGKETLAEVAPRLAPGSLAAPPGMSGGGFNLNAARKAVLH